jgi:hypothetical protein
MPNAELLNSHTLLNVGFQNAEDLFVALHRHAQCGKQSLGGEEIHDDPLLDMDRILRDPNWLGIQAKIDDQFFWRAGDSAKVRVKGNSIFVPNLNRDLLWSLATCSGILAGFLL